MWEQVALHYNKKRPRGAPERDYEPLIRKFRNLYGKKKPTGINSELPKAAKAILWAHEIQRSIELKADVRTSHDGSDRGDEDDELLRDVENALQENYPQGANKQAIDEGRDDRVDQREGTIPGAVAGRDDEEKAPPPSTVVEEGVAQDAEEDTGEPRCPSAASGDQSSMHGSIATNHGYIPVLFAQDLDDEYLDSPDTDEEAAPRRDQHEEVASREERAEDGTTFSSLEQPASASTPSPLTPRLRADVVEQAFTPAEILQGGSANTASSRVGTRKRAGRPRRPARDPLPSTAAPDGPVLVRDPASSVADDDEVLRYKRLATSSNRLGGRDLRVLRDNVEEMGGKPKTTGEKRPAPESGTTTNYANTKRLRARQRMESLDKELAEAEAAQARSSMDSMQMMVFFREEADRRAEAEDKRRREERQERREAEKQERDERAAEERRAREEREQVRREESAAQDARLHIIQELLESSAKRRNKRAVDALKSGSRWKRLKLVNVMSKCSCCCLLYCPRSNSYGGIVHVRLQRIA